MERTERLAYDLVDRLEVSGLELGSDELLHFIGERCRVRAGQYTSTRW